MIDLKSLNKEEKDIVTSFVRGLTPMGSGGSGRFEEIDYTDPEWGVIPEPTRIKITCTEDEKNWIINAFLTASLCDRCILRKYCGDDRVHKSCAEVFDKEINWEVHHA